MKVQEIITKYHEKETLFIYHSKENGLLDSYMNTNDGDVLEVLFGDVVVFIHSRPCNCVAYVSPDEFIEMVQSGEITEK